MLSLVLRAAGFGFAAGSTFGPLHTILLNVTLASGWRQGLLIAISPLITDAPIILLMLFVLETLPSNIIQLIEILGGLAVLWIAYTSWRQANAPALPQDAPPQNLSRQTLLKGVTVNFLNPNPYIFWGTIMGPLLLEGLSQSIVNGVAVLLGFYGTFIGIMIILVFVFDRLRGIDPRVTRGLTRAAVVILVFLGLQILWNGLNP